MSSKMMKTAEGLVVKVTFDDEQIEELKAYIDECFKQLEARMVDSQEEEGGLICY